MSKTDYKKDKGGWVEFNDNRPKIKLRQYIKIRAMQLFKQGHGNLAFNRIKLIEGYNENGLSGIENVAYLVSQIRKD